jgi:TPR repeat protein
LKWTKRGADQEDTEGQFQYGLLYLNGWGVEKDTTIAVLYFRKAAEKGHPCAQVLLGHVYFQGAGGLSRDIDESTYWFKRSANQGDPVALCLVGLTMAGASKRNENRRDLLKGAYFLLYLIQGRITENSIAWDIIKNYREEFNAISLKLSNDEKADALQKARMWKAVLECQYRHNHIVKPFDKNRQSTFSSDQ